MIREGRMERRYDGEIWLIREGRMGRRYDGEIWLGKVGWGEDMTEKI